MDSIDTSLDRIRERKRLFHALIIFINRNNGNCIVDVRIRQYSVIHLLLRFRPHGWWMRWWWRQRCRWWWWKSRIKSTTCLSLYFLPAQIIVWSQTTYLFGLGRTTTSGRWEFFRFICISRSQAVDLGHEKRINSSIFFLADINLDQMVHERRAMETNDFDFYRTQEKMYNKRRRTQDEFNRILDWLRERIDWTENIVKSINFHLIPKLHSIFYSIERNGGEFDFTHFVFGRRIHWDDVWNVESNSFRHKIERW